MLVIKESVAYPYVTFSLLVWTVIVTIFLFVVAPYFVCLFVKHLEPFWVSEKNRDENTFLIQLEKILVWIINMGIVHVCITKFFNVFAESFRIPYYLPVIVTCILTSTTIFCVLKFFEIREIKLSRDLLGKIALWQCVYIPTSILRTIYYINFVKQTIPHKVLFVIAFICVGLFILKNKDLYQKKWGAFILMIYCTFLLLFYFWFGIYFYYNLVDLAHWLDWHIFLIYASSLIGVSVQWFWVMDRQLNNIKKYLKDL